MAETKIPARDYTFEVDPAGGTAYVEIGGIMSWSPKKSDETTKTTDFDSDGRSESLKIETGESFTLEGFLKSDVSDGSRDAGQAACEDLDDNLGLDSLGAWRFTAPDGEVKTFDGHCSVTKGGGGNNDMSKWSVEITASGVITTS